MAKALGVKVEWLANYEYARAPLRYDAAQRLVACLAMNPVWLATGNGPMRPQARILLPEPESIAISPRDLFSNAYDKRLKLQFENNPQLQNAPANSRTALSDAVFSIRGRLAAEQWLAEKIREFMTRLPADKYPAFVQSVAEYAEKLKNSSDDLPSNEHEFIERQMIFQAAQSIKMPKSKEELEPLKTDFVNYRPWNLPQRLFDLRTELFGSEVDPQKMYRLDPRKALCEILKIPLDSPEQDLIKALSRALLSKRKVREKRTVKKRHEALPPQPQRR